MMNEPHESSITGRRKVELPPLESVKLGEPLPAEYTALLEEIAINSHSQHFAEQAKEVVYYFYALDSGKELQTQDGKSINTSSFAELIANMPFVKLLYIRTRRSPTPENTDVITGRRQISMGNPDTSFPQWVKDNVQFRSDSEDLGTPQLEAFYNTWSTTHRTSHHVGKNGDYSVYPGRICPPSNFNIGADFKGYIEVDANPELLEKAFSRLAELEIHPHETKLFESSRLVMYWSSEADPNLLEAIKKVFEVEGVPFRGPGQDSVYFQREETGGIKTGVRASNDQSMGEGGYSLDFKQEEFNATEFLKRYLQQCYKYFRNPLNPYQTSFVPFFDKQLRSDQHPLATMELIHQQATGEVVPIEGNVARLFPEMSIT